RAYIQENGIPETCRGEIDEEIVPDEGVTFEGDEEAFAAFLGATREDAWYQEIMDSPDKIHLADAAYRPDTPAAWQNLQDSPGEDVSSKIRKRLLRWMEKLPVKNQVFFYSIRSDGELEGNAKALYPWIQGKKIYRAKRLPHDKNWEMQMYYLICTSKVIVTDDYVRYLRHVRLKSSQRVIQLWHACGAFKRFGRLGTNIALDTDIATHAQYSLCCVSGEAIRLTYADAFAIPPRRVAALGVPRTDLFFDRAYIDSVKNRLYQAFPQFAGKKIFLHAPTFRDVGRDRRVFVPELDFDTFSAHLPENTILLICPHPIMTEPILHREYPNILEIRDYSTNEMMFVSDLLITDYSSVIFEYALLRKPMVFFCYDLAIYNRGFYLRYPEDLPGSVVTNQEELESYLGDETRQLVDERYEQFLRRYMTACDGNSSRRIAGIIQEML
ncbi:MAG: CDP-glycerol glycerophosphotransferase family protein, partial [Lachnospiraceae bacterium]|nr:CDP-glycerol glycerophosphotransferase family protein [Lachnospiraceae bacterium]